MTFLSTQFSSSCSNQCFWEATGKTEDSRPWSNVERGAARSGSVWDLRKCVDTGSWCWVHRLDAPSPAVKYPWPAIFCFIFFILTHYFSPPSFLTWCQTKETLGLWPVHYLFPAALNFSHFPAWSHGLSCLPFLPAQSSQPENSLPDAPNTPFRPHKHLPEWINQFIFLNSVISFVE